MSDETAPKPAAAAAPPVAAVKDVGPWLPSVLVAEGLMAKGYIIALLIITVHFVQFFFLYQVNWNGFMLILMAMNDAVARGTAPNLPDVSGKRKIWVIVSVVFFLASFLWQTLHVIHIICAAVACFAFGSRIGGKAKILFAVGCMLPVVRVVLAVVTSFVFPGHTFIAYAASWVVGLGPFVLVWIIIMVLFIAINICLVPWAILYNICCIVLWWIWWIIQLVVWVCTSFVCGCFPPPCPCHYDYLLGCVCPTVFTQVLLGFPFICFLLIVVLPLTTWFLLGWYTGVLVFIGLVFLGFELIVALVSMKGAVALQSGVQINDAGGCGPGTTAAAAVASSEKYTAEGGAGDAEAGLLPATSVELGLAPLPSVLTMIHQAEAEGARHGKPYVRRPRYLFRAPAYYGMCSPTDWGSHGKTPPPFFQSASPPRLA